VIFIESKIIICIVGMSLLGSLGLAVICFRVNDTILSACVAGIIVIAGLLFGHEAATKNGNGSVIKNEAPAV
jgi:hypothetical protein